MNNPRSKPNEILVSGFAVACRVAASVLPRFKGALSMTEAHTHDALLDALTIAQSPVCITECLIPFHDPTEVAMIMFQCEQQEAVQRASDYQFAPDPAVTALELLPKMTSASPHTKFVIACHLRAGIAKAEREQYGRHPEVAKVMGFINTPGNVEYLVKLLSRAYQILPASANEIWGNRGQTVK